jgi:hypothetical protein
MYYSRIKGPNPLIFGKKKGYVISITQLKQVPHVEQLVHNQYLIWIPTSRLKQPNPIIKGVFVPQATTIALLVNIHVIIELPIYGNDVHIHNP